MAEFIRVHWGIGLRDPGELAGKIVLLRTAITNKAYILSSLRTQYISLSQEKLSQSPPEMKLQNFAHRA